MAGRQGLEPRFCGSEPDVLPLNELPARVDFKRIGEAGQALSAGDGAVGGDGGAGGAAAGGWAAAVWRRRSMRWSRWRTVASRPMTSTRSKRGGPTWRPERAVRVGGMRAPALMPRG